MKCKGAVSQVNIERDRKVLPELVRKAYTIAKPPLSMFGLYEIAAELPTKKFYIGDDAAIAYVRQRMFHNRQPTFNSPFKQKLFEALYEEVQTMMQSEKYQMMGWRDTTMLALSRPAPCVGLTPYIIGAKLRKLKKHNTHKKHA